MAHPGSSCFCKSNRNANVKPGVSASLRWAPRPNLQEGLLGSPENRDSTSCQVSRLNRPKLRRKQILEVGLSHQHGHPQPQGILFPKGHLSASGDILIVTDRKGVLPTSSGWRPRILLKSYKAGASPTTKGCWTQNVSRAEG